jgi:threonine/homoserine/homoserine lactone efflux protein
MRIELWQVPLLVAAGIVVLDLAARTIAKRWRLTTERRKQVKTAVLGLLAVIMLGLLWRAWTLVGTSAMANVAAVVSALVEAGTLWLGYQAYRETKAAQEAQKAQKAQEAQDADVPLAG